ncbi:MAG: phosphatase PAP2 family protein [Saprospiraceae bacterium]|nr:phosphatase PAP2 family protein [Saprospiraceae bacterium]
MKIILSFILALFINTLCSGQYVHELSTEREAYIIGSGLLGLGVSFALNKDLKPLTEEEIERLNPLNINGLDRVATATFSKNARNWSDGFLYGSIGAAPLALLLDKESRADYGDISAMYFETMLINNSLTALSKTFFRRTRPYAYNDDVDLTLKLGKSTRFSFFSGHTSNVAAASFFSAKVYSDNNPGSKMKNVYWGTAAIIPAIQGYLRVKGGKHFPTDVIVGYVVGALAGILVPELHRVDP